MLDFVRKLLNPDDIPNFISAAEETELRNRELERLVEESSRAQSRLRRAYRELENKVEELSKELALCREFLKHEISEHKWDEQLMLDARAYADTLADMMRDPLVVLDSDMRVVMANTPFCEAFHLSKEELENQLFFDLNDGYWNTAGLRESLDEVIEGGAESRPIEVKKELPDSGYKVMRMRARRVHRKENNTNIVLLVVQSD
jgi:PAS domain-containing protein